MRRCLRRRRSTINRWQRYEKADDMFYELSIHKKNRRLWLRFFLYIMIYKILLSYLVKVCIQSILYLLFECFLELCRCHGSADDILEAIAAVGCIVKT